MALEITRDSPVLSVSNMHSAQFCDSEISASRKARYFPVDFSTPKFLKEDIVSDAGLVWTDKETPWPNEWMSSDNCLFCVTIIISILDKSNVCCTIDSIVFNRKSSRPFMRDNE